MSALHEAAQLALEALEYGQHSLKQISEYQWESRGQLAMDALKAALAQPEPAQGPVWVKGELPPRYIARSPIQAEPAQEPVAWATEIIDALQAQYDTEMIQENDSGDALIRLDDAIAAVEDAEKYYTASPKPEPAQEPFGYLWPTGRHPEFRFTQQKRDGVDGMPLYTAPPQRKPLTDEEILEAVGWERAEMYMKLTPNFQVDEAKKETLKNARAVERKVRGE